MNNVQLIVSALVLMLSGMGASFAELDVVDSVDLERYEGRWYEIARLPNRFQRQCVSDVSAEYRLRDDGRIDVTNRCRREDGDYAEASGVARLSDPDGPQGALEVRFAPAWLSFLPFVWGDYRILALDQDYGHALIGSDNRRYLWVLSRATEMDDVLLDRLLDRAREQGFDTDDLILTRHEEH
jgi:apolipoprotein D and lipocalin family protein